ncbi:MAG TPA: M20/M25/M40 family metallo-hydrolase [Candidatus Acidoferrales bacterium]|nr:M20/M25/M40 family metallo-hydrolase [Candidatus Acidoferrales bacterium]
MIKRLSFSFFAVALISVAPSSFAQATSSNGFDNTVMRDFVETPAIPGYESALATQIRDRLQKFSPKSDTLGDVIVTIGSGGPTRFIVAPMDEPGYVISNITSDGYLQVQRLPQFGVLPLFNELYSAEPVKIQTASGKWIPGVVGGLSVHLQPGRLNPPDPDYIENMFVDIGATSAADAKRLGADNLSPMVIDRTLYDLGPNFETGTAIGDRFGDVAVVELLRRIDPSKINGTLVVAFVAQQWAGARGLERVLNEIHADELIYVGRLTASPPNPAEPTLHRGPHEPLGSGVLVGDSNVSDELSGFAATLKNLADQNQIPIAKDYSAPLMPQSYLANPQTPEKTVHLGIATAWPDTPAEMISVHDLANLTNLLEAYAQGSVAQPSQSAPSTRFQEGGPPSTPPTNEQTISRLVETYGASDHEGRVRDMVKRLLPKWAHPETDDAGNLILQIGTAPASAHAPSILFVAHMDEIGYEVEKIMPDGKLAVESKGGGDLDYYLGHAALVHTADGKDVPGVMELPDGWDEPNFKWPRGRALMYKVDIGARSPDEVAQMGVAVKDFVTIPKQFRRLANDRANARSFDDRVGDTALISAVWALGPNLKDRDVTFVWSTGEELGLVGAGKVAARLATQGKEPLYVFAIDTFVSSDSPLELARFGDAKIGDGFVVRAVDNSNVVPRKLVEKVVAIARANKIPVQYGATGGGNDGSAFLRYGSIDVALGWPLRYSHSPGEVIDLRDLDGLARIVVALSRSW